MAAEPFQPEQLKFKRVLGLQMCSLFAVTNIIDNPMVGGTQLAINQLILTRAR